MVFLLRLVLVGVSVSLSLRAWADVEPKTETSATGFRFFSAFSPQRFEPALENDEGVREFAEKVLKKEVKLCKTVWKVSKGNIWTFSCEAECEDGKHLCAIQIIWPSDLPAEMRAAAREEFKFTRGADGRNDISITAPGQLFRQYVLLVCCECKENAK